MSLLLKECRWCGNQFVPARFNAVCCSDKCRREMDSARHTQRLPVYCRGTTKPSDGVPTIPDVVSATLEYRRMTGRFISYGKMVAIMERGGA